MADPTDSIELINQAASAFGNNSAAVQQLTAALQSAARAGQGQATASTVASNAMQQAAQQTSAVGQTFGTLRGMAGSLINGFSAVSSSVYGTDKAFTSVIPTLNFVVESLSKSIEILGKFGSGVSLFGISIGRTTEALGELTVAGISASAGLIKFGLEASQKVVDSFIDLSKMGAIFSGSLGNFAKAAVQTQVPMAAFTRIVQQNAEAISKFGLGMTNGSKVLAGMSKEIFDGNPGLIALYGNLENLSVGTAEYLSLQSQLGVSIGKNREELDKQKAGAVEYLITQKELSNITGKTAETLKREEEGRRRQLDYNLKIGRLGEVAQQNVREGMAVAGKIFGDAGAKYAEEYFATGGKVYSKEALTFAAVNQEAAQAIGELMGSVNQTKEGYREGYKNYFKQNADVLEGFARSNEQLIEINRAANNQILTSMGDTSRGIIENLNLMRTGFERLNLDQLGKNINKNLDEPTQGLVNATKALIANQQQLDQIVIKNIPAMAEVATQLHQITAGIISVQGDSLKALKAILDAAKVSATAAEDTARTAMETMRNMGTRMIGGNLPMPAVTPQGPAPGARSQNQPQQADGGVTSGPTTVGENGPEAVIPLRSGNVPMNIDWKPLVDIMRENVEVSREILDAMEDSVEVQEQILKTNY
jgi:hypothetical protein